MSKFREEFKNPTNEYRSAPFWAWNDAIRTDRVTEQIDKMKQQRMGGCFIHSREGLETEYLSDEWMQRVEEAVSYANEKELDVWIYDEDKWPSGMAGGMIAKKYPEFRAKALTLEQKDDGTFEFHIETTGNSEWYNGFGPANNLDPESVKAFLKLTHEEYERKITGFDEGKVKGFFTDEPNVCDFFSKFTEGRPWLPWSDYLEVVFKRNRGYDVKDHFEELFFNVEGAEKIRHDYCKTIAEVFGESYFKQISEWLHKHQMMFTGHLIFENDFGYNARTSGSVMPQYRYFDIPGIDILGEQDEEILTVKQCTSVANQFGKKHVMSETYGCTKWDFGLEGQKWLGDWQFIMGVTMRCQHLFMYSIKGLRKRDYPPIFSDQTTWWDKSHILEEYFARFAVCSTYGKVKRDLLVLHPQSTVWLKAGSRVDENLANWDDDMGWLDPHFREGNNVGFQFARLIKHLLVNHRDCDLGDEMLMEKYGYVKDGKIFIQDAGYSYVLIPEIQNIFASTLKLLQLFMDVGGLVMGIGPVPEYVDGEYSDMAKNIYDHRNFLWFSSRKEALDFINAMPKDIEIVDAYENEDTDMLTMHREIPEGAMLICSNHDRNKEHTVCIRMKGKGAIEKMDLVSGDSEFLKVHYNEEKNRMEFVDTLGAVETMVYILHANQEWTEILPEFSYHHPHASRPIVTGLSWKTTITRDMPNVLPLDQCTYRLFGVQSEKMPVWKAQREIREKLGMIENWYNGAPQRYTWITLPHDKNGTEVEMEFTFDVLDENVENLCFAAENLERYSFSCNGLEIFQSGDSLPNESYYLDPCIKVLPFPKSCIRIGKNTLIMKIKYTQDMELEDLYILGDFSVNQNRQLEVEKKEISMGDWCLQGYPFYGGGITYHFQTNRIELEGKRAYLYLQDWKAAVVEVKVNGQLVGHIGWKGQDGIDITDFLEDKNQINIRAIATPRNIFGPFHQKYEAGVRSSFKDFRTEGENETIEYRIKQQGLMDTVVIERR